MSNNIIELSTGCFELGPHLKGGIEMKWFELETELGNLNNSLPDNEKPWRVISMEEFREIGERIKEIRDTNEKPQQKNANVREYVEGLGLLWSRAYWSGTSVHTYQKRAWSLDSFDGKLDEVEKCYRAIACVIRPIT